MTKFLIVFVTVLALTACGNETPHQPAPGATVTAPTSLAGVYSTPDGKHSLTFAEDMKVKSVVLGSPVETSYVIDGKTVKFKFPDGLPATYSINADGSLTGPTGARYTKG